MIVKATNLAPSYSAETCLLVTRSIGGCSACYDACPHDAIRLGKTVEIDDIDCTGCGLCVQACPSQALAASRATLAAAPLKCSQVSGSCQSVQCLAQLTATDLLRLSTPEGTVTLHHADCARCSIGSKEVPEALAVTSKRAEALAAARDKPLEVQFIECTHADITDSPKALSRRAFLRGGVDSSKRYSADLLAPLEFFAGKDDAQTKPLPLELQKQVLSLKAAALAPTDKVPWPTPQIAEGCIMCPVCTNVCPTGAFSRELPALYDDGDGLLKLDLARCNGCDACVKSCPVNVISLDDTCSWHALSAGPQEVYRKPTRQQGGVAR